MRTFLIVVAVVSFLSLNRANAADAAEKRDLAAVGSHYVLIKPAKFDATKPCELIIALHGMGDTAENFARVYKSFIGSRDAILAVPESRAKQGWNTDDLDTVIKTIEDVGKVAKVDPQRVVLTGHSAGALVGWYMVVKRPDLFSFYGHTAQGVAPAVNWLFKEKDLAAAAKVPVYFAIGQKDPNHPNVAPSKALLDKLKFNYKCEEPDVPHTVTAEEVKTMLAFWDSVKPGAAGAGAGVTKR